MVAPTPGDGVWTANGGHKPDERVGGARQDDYRENRGGGGWNRGGGLRRIADGGEGAGKTWGRRGRAKEAHRKTSVGGSTWAMGWGGAGPIRRVRGRRNTLGAQEPYWLIRSLHMTLFSDSTIEGAMLSDSCGFDSTIMWQEVRVI